MEQYTQTSLKVFEENEHTYELCSLSESRLFHAIKEGKVMVINNALLLKFHGRMSALCVQDFVAPDGSEFKAGRWYSPFGDDFRDNLKHLYKKGHVRRQLENFKDWADVRPLMTTDVWDNSMYRTITPEDVLTMARDYIASFCGRKLNSKEASKRYDNTYNEDY